MRNRYFASACLTPPSLPYQLDTWLRHNMSVSRLGAVNPPVAPPANTDGA